MEVPKMEIVPVQLVPGLILEEIEMAQGGTFQAGQRASLQGTICKIGKGLLFQILYEQGIIVIAQRLLFSIILVGVHGTHASMNPGQDCIETSLHIMLHMVSDDIMLFL